MRASSSIVSATEDEGFSFYRAKVFPVNVSRLLAFIPTLDGIFHVSNLTGYRSPDTWSEVILVVFMRML